MVMADGNHVVHDMTFATLGIRDHLAVESSLLIRALCVVGVCSGSLRGNSLARVKRIR